MERLGQFIASFKHAFRGLTYALKNEKNFQNEMIIGILVIIAMFYFDVTRGEMVVLFVVIMAVLIMELLNTAMERVIDILRPKIHPYAKLVKDLMAASVLMMSILTILLGLIIFLPYVVEKVQGWGLI